MTKSILVVEDDPLTRRAMQMTLEREGYRVTCAGDGRQALDLLRTGERPALILLDLGLPVLDGRQFRREQRRDPALALIPVVVLSGGVDGEEPLGAAGHLSKPFKREELLDALRGVV